MCSGQKWSGAEHDVVAWTAPEANSFSYGKLEFQSPQGKMGREGGKEKKMWMSYKEVNPICPRSARRLVRLIFSSSRHVVCMSQWNVGCVSPPNDRLNVHVDLPALLLGCVLCLGQEQQRPAANSHCIFVLIKLSVLKLLRLQSCLMPSEAAIMRGRLAPFCTYLDKSAITK